MGSLGLNQTLTNYSKQQFGKVGIAVIPSTANEAEAQKLYSEVQHILSDEVPVLYLTKLQFPTFVDNSFHDVVVNCEGVMGDLDGAWKS